MSKKCNCINSAGQKVECQSNNYGRHIKSQEFRTTTTQTIEECKRKLKSEVEEAMETFYSGA